MLHLQIVRDIPEAVRTSEEVHHLAEFFTARLKDWYVKFIPSFFFVIPPLLLLFVSSQHHNLIIYDCYYMCRPAIRGALLGCLALFERTHQSVAPTATATTTVAALSTADALSILSSFSKNVYVRT